ncbi:Uncharacterised protein [Mycobacteroides abscessus subsp. bolletii]|nr:Uncharacterised protein [Mycobacteroides abscessus subsp. bolletii]SKT75681.1 Uncharacterised protein [Mycobacteroides abscessus subsp. bolletii]SLD35530.1 Uncharacterised protein [Mycobacteroides abscessus subsp. bolletii]SLF79306.1 Uncharacterised protein [Mycobacteroides abscessus subsp. bolletii]
MNYLMSLFVTALFDYIKKHPELVEDFATRVSLCVVEKIPAVVDEITDLIPGQLDDKIFDTLAARFAKALQKAIPGFDLIFKFLK